MSELPDKGSIIELSTEFLEFDPKNPRFPDEIASAGNDIVLEKMIYTERLAELMQSIGVQDYFSGEPLLVTREGAPEGKFFVVEGNRRLAALKMLNQELRMEDPLPSIEKIIRDAEFKPTRIPCLVFERRDSILRYLGFKHITGIKSWPPLAKARYLSQLRDRFYQDKTEDEQLRMLAKEIGSKPHYVGQMLCGLSLYDKAKASRFFGYSQIVEENIDFSILTTALGYKKITDFIGIENKRSSDLSGLVIKNYERLFYWLYVPSVKGKPVVRDSRKIRLLADIVDNPDARNLLDDSDNLEEAYSMSEGPKEAFDNLLDEIESKLESVYKRIPKIEDYLSEYHQEKAQELFKSSKRIRDVIRGLIDDE